MQVGSDTDEIQPNFRSEPAVKMEYLSKTSDAVKCGIGPCKFSWMQRLASKKTYVLVYGLIGMSHFALSSYFVGTISTLEKRFQIPSFFTGLIGSACDVGLIFTTLTASYLGRSGHKTRWVAWGTVLVALSCFIRLIPHWLYGPGQATLRTQGGSTTHGNSTDRSSALCDRSAAQVEDCENSGSGNTSAYIFMLANVFQGVGSSVYYTLGVAYLDDNAKKNKVPVLLAISQCLRMLGPTLGFLLASVALNMFVDPGFTPEFGTNDPRWIGAWWLGWGPLGVMSLIFALLISMFPRELPRTLQRNLEAAATACRAYVPKEIEKPSFKDFKETMKRLCKNKVLMCNNISTMFFLFGYIGQWTFLPKYMETQFHQSASNASLVTGTIGLMCTAAGLVVSAIVIAKFKPSARALAAWNVIAEFIDVLGFFLILFISCETLNFQGTPQPDGTFSADLTCNANCSCPESTKYSPVCHIPSKSTFFSPCHAGCKDFFYSMNGTKVFSECSCAIDKGPVLDGPCPLDCSRAFLLFGIIHCIQRFLGATGRAGNTLIHFRCVDPADKAVSMGFLEAMLCAFGFIPGPIIYGILIDMTCSVWGKSCGNTGNCWIYDVDKLRYYMNLPILGCLFIGTLWDIGVWYYAKDLSIYDQEPAATSKEKHNLTTFSLAFNGD